MRKQSILIIILLIGQAKLVYAIPETFESDHYFGIMGGYTIPLDEDAVRSGKRAHLLGTKARFGFQFEDNLYLDLDIGYSRTYQKKVLIQMIPNNSLDQILPFIR